MILVQKSSTSICFFFLFYTMPVLQNTLLLITRALTIYREPNKINIWLWQRKCIFFFLAWCQPSFHTMPHHWVNSVLYLHLEKILGNEWVMAPPEPFEVKWTLYAAPPPKGALGRTLNGNCSDLCLKVRKWFIGLDQDLLVLSPHEG